MANVAIYVDMPIGWKIAFERYEAISGVEPLYQEDMMSGVLTFEEGWSKNVRWLEDMLSDVINTQTPS